MKVEGFEQAQYTPNASGAGSGLEAAIRKQIQSLTNQLSKLERKQRPTKQDQMKKDAIKKEIAELKKQLQQAKAAERSEKQERTKKQNTSDVSEETGETLVERLKEPGVGRAIDELR